MKVSLFFLVTIIIISGCREPEKMPKLSGGSLERLENFGSGIVAPRTVDIWLPEGYSEQTKYATVYMHDGQMLFDAETTWNKQEWSVDEVVGQLIQDDKIMPCIIIAIWNAGDERHSDYFPQKPFEELQSSVGDSLLSANPEEFQLINMKVKSDKYLQFIVHELKPYIDQNYSVHKNAENTFIMGSSMGGLISMYALAEYPEIFGGAACLSTHWIGTFVENEVIPRAFGKYLSSRLEVLKGRKLYFDRGTETLDAKYPWAQKHIDTIVGQDTTREILYKSLVFEGKAHDEVSWGERLDIPLLFLLSQ